MLLPRLARTLFRRPLTDPAPATYPEIVAALVERLDAMARGRLGRSLAIRHVGAASCNGCELEINALSGVVHDLERFGLRFVASPRHADVLLVTGPCGRNMNEALLRTHAAMPDPKWVVAVGDCAVDGGVFQGSDAVEPGGVGRLLPVDLLIPGCPPSPTLLLEGLLALLEAEVTAAPPPPPLRPVEPTMESWAEPRRDGPVPEDGPG
ncbi:hydrogenase [Pseudoroseomonas rhizosphaerae]|uniref:Hydrogenase n=1 Tax=Teichococcus rhizosphaerae TaxID=1335062 RepID=A0A2C7AGZ9_9PROT|nr:NADH-quinone oxidoreductase subunit NuoB [Pseudoroseomonas rhizosphaerae]PHK95987.1 hydrogenase [Pseudoroseomonas rhizosphaerae]